MPLTPDDPIHRFKGRWIDLRGSQLPIQLRYQVWGTWAASFIASFVLLLLLTGGDIKRSVTWAIAFSVLGTMWVTKKSDGDAGLLGWLGLCLCEVRWWWDGRRAAASIATESGPYHYTADIHVPTPGDADPHETETESSP